MNFMFLENETKVCLKFIKKIIFPIWSLYADDMQNECLCRILLNFLNIFSGAFYFIHQIHSFLHNFNIYHKYKN